MEADLGSFLAQWLSLVSCVDPHVDVRKVPVVHKGDGRWRHPGTPTQMSVIFTQPSLFLHSSPLRVPQSLCGGSVIPGPIHSSHDMIKRNG